VVRSLIRFWLVASVLVMTVLPGEAFARLPKP
jgi:hypothetical protein